MLLLALLFAAFQVAAPAAEPNWKRLLDHEDFFGLRDAAASHPAPELYAGAVAAAFHHDAEATRLLHAFIARSPASRDADTAHELLVNLHYRSGHYRSALAELKPVLARHPKRRDLLEAQALFSALAAAGDMEVAARAPARLTWRMIQGNLFVPAVVNGVPGEYLLDTGANLSVLSVSEARRLGLQVGGGAASTKDYTGATVSLQSAIAPELRLGGLVLRNVPFGVIPDSQQPFVDLPEGQRGVLGMPVLLAMETWRWSKDGSLEVGFPAAAQEKSNLAFKGADPMLLAEFDHAPLLFQLDTGATSTDLWPPFARRFRSRLASSGHSTIRGVGGSRRVASAKIDSFTLAIGGRPLQLRDVKVLLQPAASGSRKYYGNLGLDLLDKAQRVTLDFGAMRLTVE